MVPVRDADVQRPSHEIFSHPSKKVTLIRTPVRLSLRNFFASLGPGIITGAADDDPSGVATYSIAGAQLGTSLLWTAWLTWPLMAAVQMMCARIGMVTGRGLAGALTEKFPKPVLLIACTALLFANTINVASISRAWRMRQRF